MTKILGRKVAVGLGKESVRGTVVAPTLWLPFSSLTSNEKIEVSKIEAGYGTVSKVTDGAVTKNWSEHEINGPIMDKGIGLLLLSLFGTVSSAAKSAPNTAVYDHTFTVAETVTHQSLTVGVDDANQDYQYGNAMVDEVSINYELGSILEFSSKLVAKKGATGSLTPAYTAENFFRPCDFVLKMGAATTDLAGASATSVRNFKLTMKTGVTPDWNLGSCDPSDINNTSFEVEGEFTEVFNAETITGYALAGTKRALSVTLTGASTIGTSSNPALAITLNQVVFDEVTKEVPLDDLVLKTYKFTGTYKIGDSKQIQAVLTNLQTSY